MATIEDRFETYFTQEKLDALFPPERTNKFFDALLGDADDGAYDIRLTYQNHQNHQLHFFIELHQRPGKCLACNLTHGLPKVFTRHPVIDLQGLIARIDQLVKDRGRCREWTLQPTREISRQVHAVPLIIAFEPLSNID
jgi:hypothetical protein